LYHHSQVFGKIETQDVFVSKVHSTLVGIFKYSKFSSSFLYQEIEKIFLKSSIDISSLNKKFNFSSFDKLVE
jgi:hypothetical protein